MIKLVEKRTELLIILQKVTNFLKKEPDELEKYWKQKKVLVKLPEKARQFMIKLPETGQFLIKLPETRQFLIKLPETRQFLMK